MLTGKEIREKFITYFENEGHTHVASSSLVPFNDPTLLFTNAGMNQFKDVFLGVEKRDYVRAVTSQKCVRAGGKHNDLETVGKTARHHTFFEMLGNFSFGDYFKRDAIRLAWTFLTKELSLPIEKLYITIYKDDDEADALWKELTPVPAERILRLGEKDNFWQMGDVGPCGPCSEIHYDRGESHKCDHPDGCALGVCDCDRWLEIWNLVFMQFERDANGVLTPLPNASIDTGMGLERITSIIQNVNSNYDTDLIRPLITYVEELTGKAYDQGPAGFPFRVIADHARSCTFLIADGVLPSNEGRGYVLRRILRRAVRFGKVLGLEGPFLYKMSHVVAELMGEDYPEIVQQQSFIEKTIYAEEERFQLTINQGMKMVAETIAQCKQDHIKVLDGEIAFKFHDTFGFPIDLTQDMAEEAGMSVDLPGFEAALAEQRKKSAANQTSVNIWDLALTTTERYPDVPGTTFVGYEEDVVETTILGVLAQKEVPGYAEDDEDKYFIILAKTPFYGEGGGQVGDQGIIQGAAGFARIENTLKLADGKYLHYGAVDGVFHAGDPVKAEIDRQKRQATAQNHTATHILHQVLREVLGEHIHQAGSYVDANRLRFDFTHTQAVTRQELLTIEMRVNEEIFKAYPITAFETNIEDAKARGFVALFGEKYGDHVRCIQAGSFSKELCGGTHLSNVGGIGIFEIISEGSVAAGVRRIEAVTGLEAYLLLQKKMQYLHEASQRLKTSDHEVGVRIEQLQQEVKDLLKDISKLKSQSAADVVSGALDKGKDIHGVQVFALEVEADSIDILRNMADQFKDKLSNSLVVLGAKHDDRVSFVATITKDLSGGKLHCGNLIREIASIAGGSGGGRPDMAQAGGKSPEKLAAALAAVEGIVSSQLA